MLSGLLGLSFTACIGCEKTNLEFYVWSFSLLYYSASMSLCLPLRAGFLTVTSNSFVVYEVGYDLMIYSAIAAPTDDAPKTIKNKGMWIILTSYIIADYISPA